MSFEEDFPSLNKEINDPEPAILSEGEIFENWKKAVQIHCLNKAKVKEAIEKLTLKTDIGLAIHPEQLKKELNLE